MSKADTWKHFFEQKGWIDNDVISGGEGEKLVFCVCNSSAPGGFTESMTEKALVLPGFDILCCETRTGSVFFQWEDIVMVRLEVDHKKKGWL